MLAPALVVGAGPLGPRGRGDRESRRAQRHHVEQHRLVVAAPVVVEETLFRRPPVTDRGRTHLRPLPVDAAVDLLCEVADLRFLRLRAVEIGLAEKRTRQEQRSVDGRELAVVEALARLHVEEVIEEALVAGRATAVGTLRRAAEEAERRKHPLPRRLARDITALDADRISSQPEADRGHTGKRRSRITIRDQAVFRVGGVPEIMERALFEFANEGIEDRAQRLEHGMDHRMLGPGAVAAE